MTISRIGSLSVATAISTDIWQKNVRRRKKRKCKNVSNVTEKDILPKTVKGSSQ